AQRDVPEQTLDSPEFAPTIGEHTPCQHQSQDLPGGDAASVRLAHVCGGRKVQLVYRCRTSRRRFKHEPRDKPCNAELEQQVAGERSEVDKGDGVAECYSPEDASRVTTYERAEHEVHHEIEEEL